MKKILWRIKEFITFQLKKNSHFFIHSPFVFQLSQQVLLNKNKIKVPEHIITARKFLQQNPRTVEYYDFGAKAKIKGEKKILTIGYIVKNMSVSHKTGSLLYRLCLFLKPKNLLELGTNIGISTMYQVNALTPPYNFTTVEANKSLIYIAKQLLRKHNINFITETFENFLQKIPKNEKYDYIFIDGNHDYNPTINYVQKIKKHLNKNAVIIIADIRWSPEMKKAFYKLTQDKDFTLTIDLFDVGLLFYKRNQQKQHFRLTYK